MLNLMIVVFHILSKTDFNLPKYASKAPYVAVNSMYLFDVRSFDATVYKTRIIIDSFSFRKQFSILSCQGLRIHFHYSDPWPHSLVFFRLNMS